jgi:hypothetical protein
MKMKQRQEVKFDPNKAPVQISKVVEGLEEYSSPHMNFSNSEVNGYLMKRIEQAKFYHNTNWHEKFFDLRFDQSSMLISSKSDR